MKMDCTSIYDLIMSDPALAQAVSNARNKTASDAKTVRHRISTARPLTPTERKIRQRGYARRWYWKHHQQDSAAYTMTLC